MKRTRLTILILTALSVGGLHAGTKNDRADVQGFTMARSMQASVSGIEDQEVYAYLPPVLVDITGSTRRSVLWVEVHRGADKDAGAGVKLDSQVVARSGKRSTLHVTGLNKVCAGNGIWTVRVMTGSGLGTRSLTQVTFEVAHDQRVQPVARPGAKALPEEPGF